MACGNFGARPKPPNRASNCDVARATARSRIVGARPSVAVVRRLAAADAGPDAGGAVDGGTELLGLLVDLVAALGPRLVDGLHHPHEAGHALAVDPSGK